MKNILVIGSLNIDLVSQLPYLPKLGETITSLNFQTHFGGKGANQAVALAKLGGNVSMIGNVGTDDYGGAMIKSLQEHNIEVSGIMKKPGTTGLAFINVDLAGENNIVLVPGANEKTTPDDIDLHIHLIEQADFIIVQLEIPLETVEYVLGISKFLNKKVILNPAPAKPIKNELLAAIDTIIPNETELELLTNSKIKTEQDIIDASSFLKQSGVNRVVVTVGAKGSYITNDLGSFHVPAKKVDAVDTTAAGDSYVAGFLIGISNGLSDIEAANFASNVSALVVTREGAQNSLPTFEEVNIAKTL